ncbi:MAG: hypothetical protein WD669_10240 [Pirellulales bacterium]
MKLQIRQEAWIAAAVCLLVPASHAHAGNLMFGCSGRPVCGKTCKLVCEEKKITAVGYGCHCETICVPGPSCQGCKHCETVCCCDTEAATKGCPPKIEFCWYDWCARGCAAPRQVKVLTKFQAERKVCWYHWEVVDGCGCGGGDGVNCGCDCVYKPAPADAQIGQRMPISAEEQVQLTSWMAADAAKKNAQPAEAFNLPETQVAQQATQPQTAGNSPAEKPNTMSRFSSLFKLGK